MRNAFFYVFGAQGTCLMAANVLSPLRGANSALPNPLAGFEGPLRGGRKREEKGRESGRS